MRFTLMLMVLLCLIGCVPESPRAAYVYDDRDDYSREYKRAASVPPRVKPGTTIKATAAKYRQATSTPKITGYRNTKRSNKK